MYLIVQTNIFAKIGYIARDSNPLFLTPYHDNGWLSNNNV